MSRVLPIKLNTEEVRAVLDEKKTVKRIIMDPQPVLENGFFKVYGCGWGEGMEPIYPLYGHSLYTNAPYREGEILYVKESYYPDYFDYYENKDITCNKNAYMADYYKEQMSNVITEPNWIPAIYMPKEAARIWLKVISVRAEHLQKITEEEAKAEGVNWKNGKHVGWEEKMKRTAIERFAELWNSSIERKNLKTYGWEENPWVWRIEFKLCDMPEEVIKERLQRGRLERLIENRGIGKTIRAIPLNFACARIIEELNKKEDFYNAFRDGIINSIKDPDTMSYPEPEDIADKIISRIMGE